MPNVLIIFFGYPKVEDFLFQRRRFLSHPLSLPRLPLSLSLSLSLRLGCKKMEVSGNRLGRLLLLASVNPCVLQVKRQTFRDTFSMPFLSLEC